jgi:ABC-2 type transport system permease protein
MPRFLLKIIDAFAWLFKLLGIDYQQFRSILEVKFILDGRRQYTGFNRSAKQDNESNSRFYWVLFSHALMGIFTAIWIATIDQHALYVMSFVYSYLLFMITFTLISDFSEIIIDTTDNLILLPRPVDSRTILLARLVHIASYLFMITLANILFSLVVIFFKFGFIYSILHLVLSLIIALVSVVATSALYLVLINYLSKERLNTIISYVQIFFTMFLVVGYQFMGRVGDLTKFTVAKRDTSWWYYLSPPSWCASIFDSTVFGIFTTQIYAFIALALVIPFVGLWATNRYLAPRFSKSLANLGTGENTTEETVFQNKQARFLSFLSNTFTKNPIEKSVFELVWKITSRDRKFKTRTFPVLGLLIYFGYRAISASNGSFDLYMFIYYSAIISGSIIGQTYYSDDFKASWIYRVAPLSKPGDILRGSKKAIIIKAILPLYCLIIPIMCYFKGIQLFDDLLMGLAVSLLFCFSDVIFKIFYIPFSKAVGEQAKGGKSIIIIILTLLIFPIFGGVHYALAKFTTWGVLVLLLVTLIVAWLLYKEYEKVNWVDVDEF